MIAAPALARFFNAIQFKRAWNEVPLLVGDVAGVIDRLVDDGERLWILDYKTTRGADAPTLLAEYQNQLSAYRDGVRQLWPGREVRAGLVLTASAEWLEAEF
jgi:ATP-dependent helicase/nuclease subunit A